MTATQAVGTYQSTYPYLDALMQNYKPQGIPEPSAPPATDYNTSIYPPYNPAYFSATDVPPPTWTSDPTDTAQKYCPPNYQLVVTNPGTAPLYQKEAVYTLPMPPPSFNPDYKQPDKCICCRLAERMNRFAGAVSRVAKGPLKLLGGAALGAGTVAFGATTLVGVLQQQLCLA